MTKSVPLNMSESLDLDAVETAAPTTNTGTKKPVKKFHIIYNAKDGSDVFTFEMPIWSESKSKHGFMNQINDAGIAGDAETAVTALLKILKHTNTRLEIRDVTTGGTPEQANTTIDSELG